MSTTFGRHESICRAGLTQAGLPQRSGLLLRQLCFEFGDLRRELVVFLAGENGHFAHRFEFVAVTTSIDESSRSIWVFTTVSTSRRTPLAMPAASVINRAKSSKIGPRVWGMGGSTVGAVDMAGECGRRKGGLG